MRSMKKGFFQTLKGLCLSLLLGPAFQIYAAELMSINFQQVGDISKLELIFDSDNLEAKKAHLQEEKQIIVEIDGVRATDRVLRGFDTSEFSGAIVYVRPLRRDNNVRLAVQLRDNVRSVMSRAPNRLILEVENRFGAFSQQEIQRRETTPDFSQERTEDLARINIPESDSIEDILENITKSGRKRYIGRRISINVRNTHVSDILRMIAEASGFNIILTEEIQGLAPLTLNMNNVPWDQALDTVLGLNQLVARKNGGILSVTTLQRATSDQQAEAEARRLSEREEPLVTRVFPLSFTDTNDMREILQEYLTPERGRISRDERTNSLIIRELPEIIEKMRRIVEVLDTETPQVLIESKIVEVTENYSKNIGLQDGLSFGYDPFGASTDGIGGGAGGAAFSFSSAPNIDAASAMGINITSLGRLRNLQFNLQLMESENKGKIISSPKVVTENNRTARISATDTRYFIVREQGGENPTSRLEEVEASLSLEVTPQVTNDGSISLEIEIMKQQFGVQQAGGLAPPPVQGRNIETTVLVENGSTIVIGGIYQEETQESHSGIPFLKDIPILGWLFRTPYNPSSSKTELVVFLTPRIVNQERASLLSSR